MGQIKITYEIVTPESAAEGDVAERGWADGYCREYSGSEHTADEVIALLGNVEPSSSAFHTGVWYTDADGDTDYLTGAERRQSYHLVRGTWSAKDEQRIYDAVTGRS